MKKLDIQNDKLWLIKFFGILLTVSALGLFGVMILEGIFGIVPVFFTFVGITAVGGVYAAIIEVKNYIHKKRNQKYHKARLTVGDPLYDEKFHRNYLFLYNRPAYERRFGQPEIWIEDDHLVTIKTPQKDVN